MHRLVSLGLGLLLVLTLALAAVPAPARGAGLAVESLLPQGRVERLTQVVVRFSRDMRALGDMSQAPENAPLRLDPRPAGSYRWLGPRTLAYILDRPLVGSSRITLLVPAGIRALDGSRLARAVRAVVETPPVEVVRVWPKPGAVLGPRPQIKLALNQPVDLASLARHSFIEAGGRRVSLQAVEAALPSWQREQQGRLYILSPSQDLPGKSRAVLVVGPGLQPSQGNRPFNQSLRFEYQTFRPLTLVRWQMDTALGGGYDPDSVLVLRFNNPVVPKEALEHLRISPPIELDPEEFGKEPTTWLYLGRGFKPRTRYRVAILPGLKDAWGTRLEKHLELNFLTGDLEPFFSLAGGKGVLEAKGRPLYPLRLRNLHRLRVGLRPLAPDQAVPALVAEGDRSWEQKPRPPVQGVGGAVAREISLELPANQTVYRPLDLKKLLGRDPKGGLVLLDVRATWPDAKGRPRERVQRAFIQVTDLGLTLKLGQSSGAAWVTRLSTGLPLAGVALELRDRTNKVLWQGVSDERGLARLPSLAELAPARDHKRPWRDPMVFLLARQGDDFALLPSQWADDLIYSILPGMDWRRPGRQSPLAAHAITQLPLYQPGQTVRLVVYLRKQTPQGLALPGPGEVTLEVRDPYGRVLHTLKGRPNAYGSLAGEFRLTPHARLGRYGIWLKRQGSDLHAGSFRVASFRPPDFRVRLGAPKDQVGAEAGGRARVQAEYLFGAPVAKGRVKLRVAQSPAHFAPPRLEGYAVGDLPLEEPRLRRHLADLEARLDHEGRARLELPAAHPLPGLPVRVGLEALVADTAGLTVSQGAGYLVHPAGVYLGLKAAALATAGQPAEVEVAAATADNQPAPPLKVKLTAYRQVWETVRERGPGGFWRYLGKARRSQVWQQAIEMGSEPYTVNFIPPQAGTYVVVAEAKDAAGRLTRSATYVYAAGQGLAGWQRFDDHRLELLAQLAEPRPGQRVRLLIKSPFARATALITLERQGVRRVVVRQVEGPAPTVELPIEAGDAPNLFLGVVLVRGRVSRPVGGGLDLGKPQVRVGYATLAVKAPDAGLKVELTTGQGQVRPGARVRAQVLVRDAEGDPCQAQVTLLAVDERVLSAAGGRNSYDPRQTFGRRQPLTVLSADTRTQVVGRRFEGQKGDQAAGGGGKGLALRRKFHPAVFWLAQAETDEQGRLAARFKLPHSLTSYRIVAIAADKSDGFGLGKAVVKARQPLQMLSALPRFAVQGDRFSARVTVQNLSSQAGEVTVRATARGLKLSPPLEKNLHLEPGESRTIGFKVEAVQSGKAWLTLRAVMAGQADAARFGLEVLPRGALLTAAAAGGLDPGKGRAEARVPLLLPAGAQPGRGGLSIVVAPSPAAGLRPAVQELIDYPWDCLEQRLSRAAARAFRLRQGSAFGLIPDPGDRRSVARTLAQAADFQTPSGGFAFWPGLKRPNVFLTAYALLAARQMDPQGPGLGPEVRQQARDYLLGRLRHGKPPRADDLPGRLAEALALAALAREEAPRLVPLLQAALTRSQGLTPFGLACLLDAAHSLGQDQAVAALVAQLDNLAEESAGQLHFTAVNPGGLKAVMGSTLRGNAAALWALCRARPHYPRLAKLAAWVALRLGQEANLSTQEAVFGLWGLGAYLKAAGSGPVNLQVVLDGRELLDHRFSGPGVPPVTVEVVRNLLEPGRAQEVLIRAQGQGRPFWSARLRYAPARPPDRPVNAGLGLSRLYRPADGPDGQPPRVGQEMESVLTLVVTQTRHHVLLSDPFPAGLEPVGAAWGRPRGAQPGGPWRWRELRKDRLLLYAPRLEPGVYSFRYRLRATVPGGFVLRPARAEEMYAPEVFGTSRAGRLVVR